MDVFRLRYRPASWRLGLLGVSQGRVNRFPIALHVGDGPVTLLSLVESFIKTSDVRIAVVGPLSIRVGVMDEQAESTAFTGSGPLQHLKITVGVAERRDGAAADELVDRHRLPLLVVDEVDLGETDGKYPVCRPVTWLCRPDPICCDPEPRCCEQPPVAKGKVLIKAR